jgi:hypothetical protein
MTITKLKEIIPVGTLIYKSRSEGLYKITKYENNSIFFSIPSRNSKVNNTKSIHIHIINIALMNNVKHLKLPFNDCRKSVLLAIINKLSNDIK